MEPSALRRAVRAGLAAATHQGLPVTDATVVHNSDRAVLRLLPGDVLARVAPVEHLADSTFEVEVARRLTDAGAPVGGLHPLARPEVEVRDGFAVSLWSYHEPAGPQISPASYAAALTRHHAALRRIALDAPRFTERIDRALREVDDRDRSPDLPDADRALLRTTLGDLGAAAGRDPDREQLLHGEPHPGNLISTAQGPLFVDLGTCCRGPVEFDLAHAPDTAGDHYPAADHGLIDRCRALNWAMFSAWRWRRDDQMPDRDHWRSEGLHRVRAALDRI